MAWRHFKALEHQSVLDRKILDKRGQDIPTKTCIKLLCSCISMQTCRIKVGEARHPWRELIRSVINLLMSKGMIISESSQRLLETLKEVNTHSLYSRNRELANSSWMV